MRNFSLSMLKTNAPLAAAVVIGCTAFARPATAQGEVDGS